MTDILKQITQELRSRGSKNLITIDGKQYHESVGLNLNFNNHVEAEYFTEEHNQAAKDIIGGVLQSRYGLEYTTSFYTFYQKAIMHLRVDPNSRRALVHFTSMGQNPSEPCLISLQWLIRDGKLQTYANFRSWEIDEFAYFDLAFIKMVSKQVAEILQVEQSEFTFIQATSVHVIASNK
jgi:thymidylate synthase